MEIRKVNTDFVRKSFTTEKTVQIMQRQLGKLVFGNLRR